MRILFFTQPGTNSRLIFRDIIAGFEKAGHEALLLELGPVWDMYARQAPDKPKLMTEFTARVRQLIVDKGVDATMAMWGNMLTSLMHSTGPGGPCTMFDLIGVPHLMYWLDAPHWAQGGAIHPVMGSQLLRGPSLISVVNNKATAAEMAQVLGFGATHALAYGINEDVFRPMPGVEAEFDVVVSCGPGDPAPTELVLRELESDAPDMMAVRSEQATRVLKKLSTVAMEFKQPEAMRGLFEAMVKSQLVDRSTPMLERVKAIASDAAFNAAATELARNPAVWCRVTMLVREVEAMERAFTVAYVSRRCKTAVFGGMDLAAWKCPATDLGVIAYEDMTRAYQRGRVGLSVMRWQDDAGINLKPFEIAASGVVAVVGDRKGLEKCFRPGEEIASFDHPAEAVKVIRTLLDDPERRGRVAQAGLERCRLEHTWAKRAGVMVGFLRK